MSSIPFDEYPAALDCPAIRYMSSGIGSEVSAFAEVITPAVPHTAIVAISAAASIVLILFIV